MPGVKHLVVLYLDRFDVIQGHFDIMKRYYPLSRFNSVSLTTIIIESKDNPSVYHLDLLSVLFWFILTSRLHYNM